MKHDNIFIIKKNELNTKNSEIKKRSDMEK